MAKRIKAVHRIQAPDEVKALTSPLRMEILGQFTAEQALSIKEIAKRIGRPATGIHYHVRVLEEAGLLIKAGQRHEGRCREVLYLPRAKRFELEAKPGGDNNAPVLLAMATAFRMAERDMEAALGSKNARREGSFRNFHAFRLHVRLDKKDLKKVNAQLDRLMAVLAAAAARDGIPDDATEFCSLTLALLPLRDRRVGSS